MVLCDQFVVLEVESIAKVVHEVQAKLVLPEDRLIANVL